jgi:hypothetical protein
LGNKTTLTLMILQLMYKECKKRENKTNKKTEGKPEQE